MKFYNGLGPNPRIVRAFLAEKSIDLPTLEVDTLRLENRKPPYVERNPAGSIPALELGDGTFIAESVAICEYLDELHPEPPLIGSTPEERAVTRMWQRRIDLFLTEHIYNSFRFQEGLGFFQDRFLCRPDMAEGLNALIAYRLDWLDNAMGDAPFICGDRFTVVDLVLFCALDFIGPMGRGIRPEQHRLNRWFARVGDRPSLTTALHPLAAKLGVKG